MANRRTSVLTISISEADKESLAAIAVKHGCSWGDNPNISELIRKIAAGELEVVSPGQKPQIPDDVATELSKALLGLKKVADLLYPSFQEEILNKNYLVERREHDAFYEAFIEPRGKVQKDKYVALCPSPLAGQKHFETTGATENEALQKMYEALESTALPENTIDSVAENTIVCTLDDPKLNGYRMMLTISS
jgi:hypothetical protein